MVRLDASRSGVRLRNRITSSAKRKATVQVKAALFFSKSNKIAQQLCFKGKTMGYRHLMNRKQKLAKEFEKQTGLTLSTEMNGPLGLRLMDISAK